MGDATLHSVHSSAYGYVYSTKAAVRFIQIALKLGPLLWLYFKAQMVASLSRPKLKSGKRPLKFERPHFSFMRAINNAAVNRF